MDWFSFVGLIFNFFGSIPLIYGSLIRYTQGKSYVQIEYPWTQEKRKVHRYNSEHREVKITREEVLMIISLSLIGIGFLLQIAGFLI